jgi:hypothetical protein
MTGKKSGQDTLIDELIEYISDSREVLDKNGLLKQPIKR